MKAAAAQSALGDDNCPVRQVLAVLGDKWSHAIIYVLGDESRRFSEIHRLIPDVSKKMLSQALDRLEADGLVERVVLPSKPPRVTYTLTPLGQRFREPVLDLYKWGVDHSADIRQVLKRRSATG